MPPRPLTLLLLVLLSVTGCATVTPGPPPADGRPQGVRGPALADRPPSPAAPVTPLAGHSALVRTKPHRPRRTPESDRTPKRRTQACTAATPRSAAGTARFPRPPGCSVAA
ncbi:hypothetical protein [Streptomyces thinghirensis]|uniref:hypothetical protein n=1 Tax=Streptomyces thinghirensis TaxID=551547 RepID=UPI0031EF4556